MAANPEPPVTPPPERREELASPLRPPPRGAPRLLPSALLFPRRVRIVEVAPRDGLQNEAVHVPSSAKIELVRDLVRAGMRTVEVTAFVSKRRVPQLSDSVQVMTGVRSLALGENVQYLCCVPNMRGLSDAARAGATQVAVMAGATDAFSKRNINCTVDESVRRYAEVVGAALEQGIRVRAYVSCALGCPYAGEVAPSVVASLAKRMLDLGCYEVALGDTIGAGNPRSVVDVIASCVRAGVPVERLAVHFHDTRGTALANVLAAMSVGVSVVDASVAGLGGCPFAPGSAGNLATEDLVNMLQGMRVDVGEIDLDALVRIGSAMCARLGCENRSRVARAMEAAALERVATHAAP